MVSYDCQDWTRNTGPGDDTHTARSPITICGIHDLASEQAVRALGVPVVVLARTAFHERYLSLPRVHAALTSDTDSSLVG